MRWKRLRQLRLAHALLLLLVPALLVLSVAEMQVRAHDVRRAADTAYDRSLLGALKAIDASVSTEAGGLAVELPYRLFEFFELSASGPVHYRVASADGLVELGSADLPAPPQPLRAGVPQFYDGSYFGAPVRVVAYTRELERPAAGSESSGVVIQVAESTQSRDDFRRVFLQRAFVSNFAFLLLAIGLAVGAVVFVLRPIASVSRELAERKPGVLAPLPAEGLPADVRPLAEAMNQHVRRASELASRQRSFLDDASHQLRTHLTTLRMQVDFALREAEPAQVHATLEALSHELQRAVRSTNQLLALARSDTADLQPAWFDLGELPAGVARQFLPMARAKGLDLGVEAAPQRAWGDAELLREAVSNLLANALAYVPEGSVTLIATEDARGWSLGVDDHGPGLPAGLRTDAGSRFLRGGDARAGGSGLGLAIAGSVAARHGGELRLQEGRDGRGLLATIWWPRPPSDGARHDA